MDTEYLQYGLLVLQRFTQKCSDWNCLFPGCNGFDNYTYMSNKCLVDFSEKKRMCVTCELILICVGV